MENIRTLHHTLSDRLTAYYAPAEADTLARYLLEEVTGMGYPQLILGEYKVSEIDRKQLDRMVERLLQHEPWQQVVGQVDFCGLRLSVTPDVLIPRPETEELCLLIRDRGLVAPGDRILDVGTGSGAIALALAHFCRTARVTALDISSSALEVAQKNARDLGLSNVTFVRSDLRDYIPDAPLDLIVSNPPYVLESERSEMAPHVLEWEPAGALFVPDDDPQLYYRLVLERLASSLRPGGSIVLELNHRTAAESEELYRQAGFDTELRKDFRGLRRFLFAKKKTTQSGQRTN